MIIKQFSPDTKYNTMKNTKILNQLMTQHGIKVTGNLHLVKECASTITNLLQVNIIKSSIIFNVSFL